jgi:hypothetical protein
VTISIRYFCPLTVTPPRWFIKSAAGFAASTMDLKDGAIGPVTELMRPIFNVFGCANAARAKMQNEENSVTTDSINKILPFDLVVFI